LHERFSQFIDGQREQLAQNHEVLLDCHASAALAAGYLMTTRAAAWPVGPRPGLVGQKPTGHPAPANGDVWTIEPRDLGEGSDLAIAVSVTHQTGDDVFTYLQGHDEGVGKLLEFTPGGGPGRNSVRDADHALSLVEAL